MKNTFKGKWVFDSNLFIYFLDKLSPFHTSTKELFSQIRKGNPVPFVAQQNILESIAILITVYNRKPTEAVHILEEIISGFNFIVINPLGTTYLKFCSLLKKVSLSKVDVFDYYLAATMIDNKIYRILTINTKDFSKIKEIEAVNPLSV